MLTKNATVRKADTGDIDEIMRIWKAENIKAHSFISPDYWENNYLAVKKALPEAEIYVFSTENEISGFIGLSNNYIEGIFVKENKQRNGVGSSLLNKAKSIKNTLTLNVYKKNINAVKFYLKNGFTITNESIDECTDESEYIMLWENA